MCNTLHHSEIDFNLYMFCKQVADVISCFINMAGAAEIENAVNLFLIITAIFFLNVQL